MSEILIDQESEQRSKTPLLVRLVSGYFIVAGSLGLIAIALAVGARIIAGESVSRELTPQPLSLAGLIATWVGMLIAGLQLSKRRRSAAIAASVAFALPLIRSVMAGSAPSLVATVSAAVGGVLLAAIWKDLDK